MPGARGQDRVIAELLRIPVARTTLGLAAHLADGGVEVDDEPTRPRARTEGPGPAKGFAEHPVELADVTEGERPQERSERGRCHHPMPQHRLRGPGAQHVGVVDMGPARRHGVHQGEHLAPRQRAADPAREVDGGIDQALEAEPGHQRGHEQQTGIGHQVRLVEGHLDAVDPARY